MKRNADGIKRLDVRMIRALAAQARRKFSTRYFTVSIAHGNGVRLNVDGAGRDTFRIARRVSNWARSHGARVDIVNGNAVEFKVTGRGTT